MSKDSVDDSQAVESLMTTLRKSVDYHIKEYTMTTATVVGTIEMLKVVIIEQSLEEEDE